MEDIDLFVASIAKPNMGKNELYRLTKEHFKLSDIEFEDVKAKVKNLARESIRMWITYSSVDTTDAQTINLLTGKICEGCCKLTEEIITVSDFPTDFIYKEGRWEPIYKSKTEVAFRAPRVTKKPILEDYLKIAEDLGVTVRMVTIKFLSNWPLGGLKAMLQKMIRFGAWYVDTEKGNLSTLEILIATSICMIMHPGAYVPHSKQFVTGIESFTRRLGVTIIEDSSVVKSESITALLAASTVSQKYKMWIPSISLVKTWINLVIEAYNSERFYDYKDVGKTKPYIINTSTPPLQLAVALLNYQKKFSSDIQIATSVAENSGRTCSKIGSRKEIVPIFHCVDHKWAPSLVYFMENMDHKDEHMPFAPHFKYLWEHSASLNFRKSKIRTTRDLREIWKAQCEWFRAVFWTRRKIVLSQNTHSSRYTLDNSCLSKMIGSTDLHMVTLDSLQPKIDAELTEGQIEISKIVSKSTLEPNLCFSHSPVKLVDGTYMIGEKTWDEIRNCPVEVPIHTDRLDGRYLSDCLRYSGEGVSEDFQTQIPKLVEDLSLNERRRLLTYIHNCQKTIRMIQISHNGASYTHMVSLDDVKVFHFFSKICLLVPSAIQYTPPDTFNCKPSLLWWSIRDNISTICSESVY